MGQFKPPSSLSESNSHLFLVGRDSHGSWVVQEQNGLRGGLFVDRKEALKFAMYENGTQPQAIVMIPGVLELEIAAKTGPELARDADVPGAPRAA
jgi:hypothetical protein